METAEEVKPLGAVWEKDVGEGDGDEAKLTLQPLGPKE